jgi:heptosyltransferase III
LPAERAILCHVASSQPKKEWPLEHWVKLHRLAKNIGWNIAFTMAQGEREQALMVELRKLAPDAVILPFVAELPLLLAVWERAAVFISGDTGPLHFAAGLGVPTVSLFGPSSPARWAPIGPRHQFLTGVACLCDVHSAVCTSQIHCMAAISPDQVWDSLRKVKSLKA